MTTQHTLTRATITVLLEFEGPVTPEVGEALENLAAVMAVQAEDGLWTLGSPEAESEAGSSEHLLNFTLTHYSAGWDPADEAAEVDA